MSITNNKNLTTMKTKHLLAMFLTVALSMGLTSCLYIEVPKTDSGVMEDVKWVYDFESKTLTFSGTGEITSNGEESYVRYADQVKTVIINEGITGIGKEAFHVDGYNFNFKSVAIPNSVTNIGSCAFMDCSALTSITIPSSVTSITDFVFYGCSALTSITIPNSVTNIGSHAFDKCSALTSVTIPNNVTKIGYGAFWGCRALTSITFPSSVTSIGSYAFHECYLLSSVTCLAVVPPTLGEYNVFYSPDAIDLYVPKESISAYKEAEIWKKFKSISAIK